MPYIKCNIILSWDLLQLTNFRNTSKPLLVSLSQEKAVEPPWLESSDSLCCCCCCCCCWWWWGGWLLRPRGESASRGGGGGGPSGPSKWKTMLKTVKWIRICMEDADPDPGGKSRRHFSQKVLKTWRIFFHFLIFNKKKFKFMHQWRLGLKLNSGAVTKTMWRNYEG